MNEFIKHILTESFQYFILESEEENYENDFFKPKGIKQRIEIQKKKIKEFEQIAPALIKQFEDGLKKIDRYRKIHINELIGTSLGGYYYSFWNCKIEVNYDDRVIYFREKRSNTLHNIYRYDEKLFKISYYHVSTSSEQLAKAFILKYFKIKNVNIEFFPNV
jgi:hypothetical protein